MTADEWLDWPAIVAEDSLLRRMCHAAIADMREGRLGAPTFWGVVFG